MLKQGLYEQVLNKELEVQLEQETDMLPKLAPIDNEEAPKIFARYLAEVIEKELLQVKGDEEDKLQNQIAFVNSIVDTIGIKGMSVDKRAEMLMAIINRKNSVHAIDEKAVVIRPSTSIAQSSLFTGAVHEPAMYSELKKEILSCDRIDMLVSFIKLSGLVLIIDELRTFTQKGGKLRVITTSYMGVTDIKAVEELRQLINTEIKISYNTKSTRLHAKTYVFYRDTGFTTAYVGSSNLSNAAMSRGLEWNVKVTAKDLADTITKIDATFESYWNSNEFTYYSEKEKSRLQQVLKLEKIGSSGDGHFSI